MTSRIARVRVRTPEQMERNRLYAIERRNRKREEAGALDRAQWIEFVRKQAEVRRAAGVQPVVRRARPVAAPSTGPCETVDQFRARGGVVDVLPGFAYRPGPIPARHYARAGLL